MFNKSSYSVRFETVQMGKDATSIQVIRCGGGQKEQLIGVHMSKSEKYIERRKKEYTDHFAALNAPLPKGGKVVKRDLQKQLF